MPVEPSDFDPQQLWQSQTAEYDAMTLADIHLKARNFQSRISRRNAVEYVACVVVVLGFLPGLLHQGSWMMQVGCGLNMLAAVFVAWQLHRRGSARTTPEAGQGLVDFHRRELIRQRDAINSVGVWYIGPFIPGMALIMLGRWFHSHSPRLPIGFDHLVLILTSMIMALFLVVVWLLNKWGAARLQVRIDELDALHRN